MKTTTVALLLSLALLAIAACQTTAPTAQNTQNNTTREASQSPSTPLAKVPAQGLLPMPTQEVDAHLDITPDAIHLNGTQVLSLNQFAWTNPDPNSYMVRPLFEALVDHRAAYRDRMMRQDKDIDSNNLPIVINVHPDAPYLLLTQTLYTAGQSAYADFILPVTTGSEIARLNITMPKLGPPPGPDDEPPTMCSSASTSIYANGALMVHMQPSSNGPLLLERIGPLDDMEGIGNLEDLLGDAQDSGGIGFGGTDIDNQDPEPAPIAPAESQQEPTEPPSFWQHQLAVPKAGQCPSVLATANNQVDTKAFAALLKDIYAIDPLCDSGTVTADEAVTFQAFAQVAQVHAAQKTSVIMAISMDRLDQETDFDCTSAVVPKDFHPTQAP